MAQCEVDTNHGMVNVFDVPRSDLDGFKYQNPIMIMGQNCDGSFSIIPIMPIDPKKGRAEKPEGGMLAHIAWRVNVYLDSLYSPTPTVPTEKGQFGKSSGMASMACCENLSVTSGDTGDTVISRGIAQTVSTGDTDSGGAGDTGNIDNARNARAQKYHDRHSEQLLKLGAMLRDRPTVSVSELSRLMGVSRSTIRTLKQELTQA